MKTYDKSYGPTVKEGWRQAYQTGLLVLAVFFLGSAPALAARSGELRDSLPQERLADSGVSSAASVAPWDGPPLEDPRHLPFSKRFIHKVGLNARPEYVVPTHEFLAGYNYSWEPIDQAFSGHLTYAFQFHPNTYRDRISGSAYQGIGVAGYTFFDSEQLGNPAVVYLLQGARIAGIGSRLSLNYEWNFGLSFGWKPYNEYNNEYNKVIGSKINAYINADFYLNWMLSRRIDLTAGITLTHFSNGSTNLPNAGLNTIGARIGMVYNFNREHGYYQRPGPLPGPAFRRHMSYDVVLFGSWRKKGVRVGDGYQEAPDTYTVLGFNINPMYNVGYKFRAGLSLDGVYDGSANVIWDDLSGKYVTASSRYQMALGVSARAEYVMPYFTVAVGLGANFLHGGGDLKTFYQILALKMEITRNSFLHIGYSLKQFKAPNFLMLGVGYRFNNKPQTYRP